ncbi:MAG: T9SS type A sorting domain-containing protein, partial [Bacteroidota bacterium]
FTNEQINVMKADFNSFDRAYLRSSYVPNLNDITGTAVLVDPINDKITEGHNRVDLDWDGVDEADRYLVQVDRLPDFSFDLQEQIVFGTSTSFYDLDPNRFYYWRVLPFNEYDMNASYTQNGRFKTGTGTVSANQIEGVNNWYIHPNPLTENSSIDLVLDTESGFQADISVYSVTGQELQQLRQQDFGVGRNIVRLDAMPLPTGIYIISIQTGTAVMNRRLVVQ